MTDRWMLAALVVALGCGGDGDDLPFGDTAVVAVVNPIENDGNTAGLPAVFGDEIAELEVDVDPGGSGSTDSTGLAVIDDVDAGDLEIQVEEAPPLALGPVVGGDVLDVAVGFDGGDEALYPGFPIRYQVGGDIVVIGIDDDATDVLTQDGLIVFFEDGVHVGDLLIQGEDVILFGEGLRGDQVVVDGSIVVRGGNVRIRGITITGNLTVEGNNFGMAFSVVEGSTQLNGQAISFLRNVFCLGASVPSSNAALYDNAGLAPIPAPPSPVCP
jgi:hypothetical protein